MQRFIRKTIVAAIIVLGCHFFAAWNANGRADGYYLRFTGEAPSSMVLGTSRAAQGFYPAAFDDQFDPSYPLFNFGFTRGNSPYGPTYLNAISKKLEPSSVDGSFILSVDPWALSERKDQPGFPEAERFLGRMRTFNSTPNLEYLVRAYGAGWGGLIGGPLVEVDTTLLLHENGWLEVRIPMDSASIAQRSHQKMKEYEALVKEFNYRSDRLFYLERTIEYLKAHGTVTLVRIPVSAWMRDLEDRYRPGFSEEMRRLADQHDVRYVDDTEAPGPYDFTDGNHLAANSAKEYSRWLAARLR